MGKNILERTSEATAEISLKYDVVLSRTFVTTEDYATRSIPFLMNVRRFAFNDDETQRVPLGIFADLLRQAAAGYLFLRSGH